jgi:hypothetical protein
MSDQKTNTYCQLDVNQQDLDRDFSLPASSIFKWMQAARMGMGWVGPGYAALSAEEVIYETRIATSVRRLTTEPG